MYATTSSPTSTRRAGLKIRRFSVLAVLAVAVLASALIPGTVTTTRAATDGNELSVELVPVADGLDTPVFVSAAPGEPGKLFVVEQPGQIRVIDADGVIGPEPFLDLRDDVIFEGERGLLGLAFHPDYATNGRLFVNYTRAGDGATVVSEFTAADGVADAASERELLVIEQPYSNHNGGMIAFDAAGALLIGTGDGGSGGDPLGAGQDPGVLLGKLLRIDVDHGDPYGIPADNGFANSDAHRPELHATGLRNPWRFSVDPEGGHIYIGDVGQGDWEEISVLPNGVGGLNFGWNAVEGPACFTADCDVEAYAPPALSYGRDKGCSIIGGYAYRGTVQPALQGIYLFGDYCSGLMWAAHADELVAGEASAVQVLDFDGDLVSFGTDEAGELYVVDRGGRILHIVATAAS